MSNANDISKVDQIAFRVYTKCLYTVNDARITPGANTKPKVDKWFNLETPDCDLLTKEIREKYKSVSVSPPSSPLEIEVLLAVPEMSSNQVLVHLASDTSRVRIEPKPSHILLERWSIAFEPRPMHNTASSDVIPAIFYKSGISLFRSLYTMLRILPAWKMYKRYRGRANGFNIQLRVRSSASSSDPGDVLDFGMPPSANASSLPTQKLNFAPLDHPMGTLSLSATYLSAPTFRVDELESLLSSRFLSLEEGPDLMPTLTRNRQRDSLLSAGGSPSSLGKPRSPSNPLNVDRFIIPSSSTSGSPRSVALPLPPSSTSNSSPSDAGQSSVPWDSSARGPSGLAARLRKESAGGRSSADLPGTPPAPLPIRRPNINPVHPFKSNTVSTNSSGSPSLSIRQQAPFLGGSSASNMPSSLKTLPMPSSSLRSATQSQVPISPTASATASSTRFPVIPPSPIGIGSTAVADDERAGAVGMPSRKRYSSSFGHRYANSGGAGSEGSMGSGGDRGAGSAGAGASGSNSVADDDISMFMQDIESRKPLIGRQRLEEQQRSHSRAISEGTSWNAAAGSASPSPRSKLRDLPAVPSPLAGQARTLENSGVDEEATAEQGGLAMSPPTGTIPMLTNESDVDRKLKAMNDAFLASLKGLGGGGEDRTVRRRDKPPSD